MFDGTVHVATDHQVSVFNFLGDSSRDMHTMWEEDSLWEDGRKMQRLSSGEPS